MSGLTLVLDATDRRLGLFDVAAEFARAGLTKRFLWLTANAETQGAEFVVLPLDPDQATIPDTTLNEAINALAPAEAIRLHVLVDGAIVNDPEPHFTIIRKVRRDLEIDFGQRFPLATTLIVLPPDDREELPATARSLDQATINTLGEWRHIFVVSREDSPSPVAGNQLRDEFAAVVVHTLLGIDGMWQGGRLSTDVYDQLNGLGGRPRIVRGWTRLVDGGFLADHIAISLPRTTLPSLVPPRTVLDRARSTIVTEPEVESLLAATPPHRRPSEPLTGLAYIMAFIPFFLRRFARVAWTLLLQRLLGPIFDRTQRLIDRIAVRLGAPRAQRKERTLGDPWATVRESASSQIETVERGGEGDLSAEPSAEFWRPVTARLIGYVDRCELAAADVVGPQAVSGDHTVAEALSTSFATAAEATRSLIDEHLKILGSTPETEEVAEPVRIWRRAVRWFRRKWAWFLIFIGAFLTITGLIAPGLGLVLVGAASLGATWLLAAFNSVLQRVIELFQQHNAIGLDDYQVAENLGYYVRHWTLLLHRRSQLDAWQSVLRVLFSGVGASGPIPVDRQCDFLPAQTPDSLVLATGVCGSQHVAKLTVELRKSNEGSQLFQQAFELLLQGHPLALFDTSRHGIETGLKSLRMECLGGLRVEARDQARLLVEHFLRTVPPTDLVEGAAEWVRKVDRYGRRYWTPPDGVTPLGPAGRALATEASRPQIELAGDIVVRGAALIDADIPTVGTFLEGNLNRVLTTGTPRSATDGRRATLAELNWSATDETRPLPLGGIGSIRPGRQVMTVEVLSGNLFPRLATIVEQDRGGSFVIDIDAPLGAPVVDVVTHSLIGVVLSSGPTLVAGPLMIRAALATAADGRPSTSPDLDPAFRIPHDVSAISGLGSDPVTVSPSTIPLGTSSVQAFLEVALKPSSENFVRRVAIDPGLLRVGQRFTSATNLDDAIWKGLDGRLMLSAHTLEFSADFDLSELTFTRREFAEPHQTGTIEI